jgi:hypothetical protein
MWVGQGWPGSRLRGLVSLRSAPNRFRREAIAGDFWGCRGVANWARVLPLLLPTVWTPRGNDRELSARLLILSGKPLRGRVRTPVFVAHAVPLRSETFDFGGQCTAARAGARTPHAEADEGQNQRDARPVASDAIDALLELRQSGAWLRPLRRHHRPPVRMRMGQHTRWSTETGGRTLPVIVWSARRTVLARVFRRRRGMVVVVLLGWVLVVLGRGGGTGPPGSSIWTS